MRKLVFWILLVAWFLCTVGIVYSKYKYQDTEKFSTRGMPMLGCANTTHGLTTYGEDNCPEVPPHSFVITVSGFTSADDNGKMLCHWNGDQTLVCQADMTKYHLGLQDQQKKGPTK